jgi:hypothetical protein
MNIFSIELWLLFSIISIPIWFVASYQITKSIIGSIITGTIITLLFSLSLLELIDLLQHIATSIVLNGLIK